MVALPIGYDQPGVATRIKYHGVGESLEVETLTGQELLEAIRKVLEQSKLPRKGPIFPRRDRRDSRIGHGRRRDRTGVPTAVSPIISTEPQQVNGRS